MQTATLATTNVIDTTAGLHHHRTTHHGIHLESARDSLRALRQQMDPQDYDRSPRTSLIRARRDGLSMQLLQPGGLGEPMELSRTAQTQLARTIAGAHTVGVLRRLAMHPIGDNPDGGAHVATTAWNTFALQHERPVKYRTANDPVTGSRSVRAVLSQGYPVYDHLDFLDDVLGSLGDRATDYRVIDQRITDASMRIRLIGGNRETLDAWRTKEVDKPFPIIDLWNSETGQRAVYVKGGTFTLWCSNGCGHWSNAASFRWNHSGNTADRIRSGVSHALDELRVRNSEMLSAYTTALNTTISDTMGWFTSQFERQLTDGQAEAIEHVLHHEPTVHGEGRLLASIVDAVTFVAHEQANEFEQERLEQLGGLVLERGLRHAEHGRILVPAAA